MDRSTLNLLLFVLLRGSGVVAQNSANHKQPLPVSDSIVPAIRLGLPVMKDNSKIFLNWELNGFKGGFFKVERSANGKDFEPIAIISAPYEKRSLEFIDESPGKTVNYYRIRSEVAGEPPVYSRVVSAGITGSLPFRIYPNPVDKVLIVRTEEVLELTISDVGGKTRISQQLQSGLQLINVSALEKGIYVLVLSRSGTNTLVTEKLVKN